MKPSSPSSSPNGLATRPICSYTHSSEASALSSSNRYMLVAPEKPPLARDGIVLMAREIR